MHKHQFELVSAGKKKTQAAGQSSVCSRFHSIRGIDFGRLIVVACFVCLATKFGIFYLHLNSQYCGNRENGTIEPRTLFEIQHVAYNSEMSK